MTSRHPVRALLQIVVERDAGLLVFGPTVRRRIRGPRALRAAASAGSRRDAPCLVWVAPDGLTRRLRCGGQRPPLRYETRSAIVNELVQ